MKLLVTGVAGMIGGHVARLAAAQGHEVHGITRRSAGAEAPAIIFHQADLLDGKSASEIIARVRPTHVVHAAWETTQPTYWDSLVNLDWVKASADLACAFAAAGGRRFVQIGSCAEYLWNGETCVEGETPDRPATRYGLAKLAAFKAIEAAAFGHFEAAEARIFFVYGPGENRDRLIPYICRSHAAGRVPELSSGAQIRDLLYADDAAAALLSVAQSDLTGIVNIGGGVPMPLAEAARILADQAGRESGLGLRPDRPGDPEILFPDVDRLFGTGWRPAITLEQGLALTYDHWARSGT